jgi:methionyl-tRNA formyltransferase
MTDFVFFGGKAIGNYVLSHLISDGIIPKAIVCYRDHLDADLLNKAKSYGVSVMVIQKFRVEVDDVYEFIKNHKPDFFISVAFQFILPGKILNLVKWPINIHTGAIPKYRGHHPIAAAFLNDEPYQATTVHLMAEEVDSGKVLLQDFIKVQNEDDMVSIRQQLIELSYRLLKTVIHQLKNDCLYPKEQVGEVVWAPKRTPEDSKIDFNNKSRYLHNFIRTLVDPYPNAFGYKDGEIVKIKRSVTSNKPGVILKKIAKNEYIISTQDGILWIETDVELNEGDQLL